MSNNHEKIQNKNSLITTFTQREIDCITQVLQEKSLLQIAETLKLSRHSVHFRLINISAKFNLLAKQALDY